MDGRGGGNGDTELPPPSVASPTSLQRTALTSFRCIPPASAWVCARARRGWARRPRPGPAAARGTDEAATLDRRRLDLHRPHPPCRKRSFATHAGRATPASRRPGTAGVRREQRLPRPRVRRPGRPAGARQLPAKPCAKTMCSSSGSSTAPGRNLAHLVNTVQDLPACSVGLRVLAGQGAQGRHHDRGRPARVRHLRGAGRVRAGADPRTHRGGARGRAGSRTEGRQEVRADEGPVEAGPVGDGAPRHVGVRAVPRAGHQAGDASCSSMYTFHLPWQRACAWVFWEGCVTA